MYKSQTHGALRRTAIRMLLLACLFFIVCAWYAVAYSARMRQAVFRGFVAALEDHGARLSGVSPSEQTIAVVDLTTSQFNELTLDEYLKKFGMWRIDRLIVGTWCSQDMVVRLRRDFNIGIVEECNSIMRANTEQGTAADEAEGLSVRTL